MTTIFNIPDSELKQWGDKESLLNSAEAYKEASNQMEVLFKASLIEAYYKEKLESPTLSSLSNAFKQLYYAFRFFEEIELKLSIIDEVCEYQNYSIKLPASKAEVEDYLQSAKDLRASLFSDMVLHTRVKFKKAEKPYAEDDLSEMEYLHNNFLQAINEHLESLQLSVQETVKYEFALSHWDLISKTNNDES